MIFYILVISQKANSQYFNYEGKTEVSLLTCAPGKAVYAKFGHTAIRIRDEKGLDLVFNYGVFDFNTPNFLLKFLKGHTDYLLGVYPASAFLAEYKERNSTVWEQTLNLKETEKIKLIELLNINYAPANRVYRYNFVYDNCATRPRNIIKESVDGLLISHSGASEETYRQLISNYLSENPWLDLGINLILGTPADRKVRENGELFLPELLRNNFQYSHIKSYSSKEPERKLVSEIKEIVIAQPEKVASKSHFTSPLFIFTVWFLLGVYMTFKKEKHNKSSKIFDTVLYGITGLTGIFIFVFSFVSVHALVSSNINLLWLNPLNIFIAGIIWIGKVKKLVFFYHIINIILIIVFVGVSALFVQSAIIAVLPIIALLILRTFRRVKRLLHKLTIPTDKGLQWNQ